MQAAPRVSGAAGADRGGADEADKPALRARARIARFAHPALLGATGLAMLAWTWGTWPDVLIDFGRELYVPWQLSQGRALFTEIAWFNGPLSPYFNAALFELFGVGLRTLVLANVALLALATFVLHRLLARMAGAVAATAACLVFLLVFAFGQLVGIGNYNWISPYSHEATHGTLLSLGALLSLDTWRGRPGRGWLAIAGLLLGLVFLTKAEIFLAAALACALAFVLWTRHELLARISWKGNICVLGGAALVPLLCSFVLLWPKLSATEAARGTLGTWVPLLRSNVAQLAYYRSGMGVDAPLSRLGELATWAGGYALVLAPAAALAFAARRGSLFGRALAGFAFAVVAAALCLSRENVTWLRAARPLPLFSAIVALAAAIVLWRGRSSVAVLARARLALPFAAFALAMLFKMLLNARTFHYGFVLALPASALLVVALVGWIPQAIDARGCAGVVFLSVAIALLAVGVVEHLRITEGFLARKSVLVGEGADRFRADARGAFANEAVRLLRLEPASTTVAVLPEGVMLNYLARRANPTPYVNFMPPEIELFGDEAIVARFQAQPPDWIVLVHKDTSEYGFPFFGRDYGREIALWIQANYDFALDLGQPPLMPGTAFGIRLLQRKK